MPELIDLSALDDAKVTLQGFREVSDYCRKVFRRERLSNVIVSIFAPRRFQRNLMKSYRMVNKKAPLNTMLFNNFEDAKAFLEGCSHTFLQNEIQKMKKVFDALADGVCISNQNHPIQHANSAKFRRLAEVTVTSDWLWEVDANGSYTYSSPIVYELLGYLPEEILGKKPFDLMPKDEAERIGRVFWKLKAEGRPLKAIKNVNQHKNGYPVILETSGVPIFNDSGAVIGFRGIDRNISTRKAVFAPDPTRIDAL
jgi:PAS domain S-box-containing protein